MDEKMKADFDEMRTHTREAARSTLVAVRDGLDFLIRKLDDRHAGAGTAATTASDVPPARPGDEPVRDSAFDV